MKWTVRHINRVKKRKKERKCICPDANYKLVKLPVGLNECDYIRKLLYRNHMNKIPSKTTKCKNGKNEITLK